ncbi:uncharacterized protein LOC115640378 [Gopherus evgoodei]|uniref:uncharacterized protein LOC115640378 n=1 Tax=Gopherus evgoodei TaxID=1825980 RepID=UPI0011CFE5C8|nr:uncharacterized protein LOC115640378 [Gopherus evgoodei]
MSVLSTPMLGMGTPPTCSGVLSAPGSHSSGAGGRGCRLTPALSHSVLLTGLEHLLTCMGPSGAGCLWRSRAWAASHTRHVHPPSRTLAPLCTSSVPPPCAVICFCMFTSRRAVSHMLTLALLGGYLGSGSPWRPMESLATAAAFWVWMSGVARETTSFPCGAGLPWGVGGQTGCPLVPFVPSWSPPQSPGCEMHPWWPLECPLGHPPSLPPRTAWGDGDPKPMCPCRPLLQGLSPALCVCVSVPAALCWRGWAPCALCVCVCVQCISLAVCVTLHCGGCVCGGLSLAGCAACGVFFCTGGACSYSSGVRLRW